MKILHLSSEKTWRGGEQQIAYLIGELARLGVQSHVAARHDSQFLSWCRADNIPHTELAYKSDMDIGSAMALKKYCKKEKFDVIHLHSSRGHGIAFLSALLGNKTPLVLSRRVDFPLKNNFLSRAKYSHSAIRKIICVSQKVKDIVCETTGDPARCTVVYDGIYINRFAGKGMKGAARKELGIADDAPLIGNVAALAPHKDYFTFLETARLLKNQTKAKFLITGEGGLREEILNKINELGLSEDVYMLGFRKDLENIYAALDVLLYTSKEEGLGSSLLDAMACGVPVVATEAGGIPEIVKNEFNGLTAPVQDAQGLAAQVTRMLNDEALRNTLTANALDFVKGFSKEVMAAKTLEVYKQVSA